MSGINFFRGPTADVASIPIADGQILFDTDKRTISTDYYNTRLVMGSVFKYHYPLITADMWLDNTAFIGYVDADKYNIMMGVPNPTNIENIEAVRSAALSIASINNDGIIIQCTNTPNETIQLALQLSEKLDVEEGL